MEECTNSLALHILLSLVSHATQDHLSKGGTVSIDPSPPISVINQENAPQIWPQDKLMEEKSQWKFSLPSDFSLCLVDKYQPAYIICAQWRLTRPYIIIFPFKRCEDFYRASQLYHL